jgi:hypothetical protein
MFVRVVSLAVIVTRRLLWSLTPPGFAIPIAAAKLAVGLSCSGCGVACY